jgi:Zn-dependent M16 (insulinase) family peptidase
LNTKLLRSHPNPSRYLISPPYAVIYGKPSAILAERLESDEKVRIDEQIAKLDKEGLAKAASELETAQAYNDRPIPSSFLTSFPLPNVGNISWIPVQSVQNGVPNTQAADPVLGNVELANHVAHDRSELPFFVQYDHVKVGPQSHVIFCVIDETYS